MLYSFVMHYFFQILGKKYNCKVAPNAEMTKLELKTDNSELAKAADKYVRNTLSLVEFFVTKVLFSFLLPNQLLTPSKEV